MYNLKSITLIESNFDRNPNLDFEKEIQNVLNIDVKHSVNGDELVIYLNVTLEGKTQESTEYKFFTTYAGVFGYTQESEPPLETFASINGPAIIFPFVREQMASLSVKAGLNTVLLPPINFTKFKNIQTKN